METRPNCSSILFLTALACAAVSSAQEDATPEIRVAGEATLNVAPDQAEIASYTATNIVSASAVSIDSTGELIDAARQARAKADALADALGLEIARVLSVVEGSPAVVRPYAPRAAMMQAEAAAPTTPVEPGSDEVRASVTLRVLVTPK